MSRQDLSRRLVALAAVVWIASGAAVVGQTSGAEAMHRPFTELLDLYVRDGLVYYRALQMDRARLDRYIASLDVPATRLEQWSREDQMAFWLNAYNAFVLKTVIDRYPIRGQAPEYPAGSIRQIPGAFDGIRHRAGGRSVTLDEIEKDILAGYDDPRLFFALGRGALGSGRLRSEAYVGARLDDQLKTVAAETAAKQRHIDVDALSNVVSATPIFSWRQDEFIEAYAGGNGNGGTPGAFASRSPIERAILNFIEPHLFPLEREFLQKNEFRVEFHEFDWRLNDLTGGRPD